MDPTRANETVPPPTRRLKILHLEDNPTDALLVREMLDADQVPCDVVVVSQPEEFERELARGDVDVVISDYSLPHYCGTEALQHARTRGPDLPFIFVSGSIGEERAVEAVRLGATDYVMKEHLRRLGVAVAAPSRPRTAPAGAGKPKPAWKRSAISSSTCFPACRTASSCWMRT